MPNIPIKFLERIKIMSKQSYSIHSLAYTYVYKYACMFVYLYYVYKYV